MMTVFPNVWGRGALFAYSGLEGTATYHDSLCGQLMAEHIGITLDDGAAELYLRLTGTPWVQEISFSLVASDLIEGTLKDNAPFGLLFLDQNTIAGFAPSNVAVPIFHADLGKAESFEGGIAYQCEKGWYAFASRTEGDTVFFSVSRHKEFPDATAKAVQAIYADLSAQANKLRHIFDWVPDAPHATEEEQRTLAKCFSVMKSQVYTQEGVFKGRWTTPDRTPHRRWWLWDSAFHSIGNAYIDPELAYDTLRTILDVQEPDGFIPHMSYPEGWIVPHTQPPLIAWALYRLYEKTGRKDWVENLYEGNRKSLNWIMKNRDANGNFLYEWYVDPNVEVCRCGESGMDNTPRFDVVQLMDSIDFSCYMANEMRHMEKLARILDIKEDAEGYASLFAKMSERINAELYDEEDGRYYDRELESGEFRKVSTPAGFLPLFAGVCPPDRAKRLAEDICNPNTFGTPLPIPTVALNDPYHSKDYWRGTVWINYSYMVQQGLRDNGFVQEADWLADATIAAVAHWYMREGCIFEIYDPQNMLCPSELERKGPAIKPAEYFARLMAVRDFGWSSCLYAALVLERESRNS